MSHAVQQSQDTEERFVGAIVHDDTTDLHVDIFGGVNWETSVWCGLVNKPGNPGLATLVIDSITHTDAPHGEPEGTDIQLPGPSVIAPAGGAGNATLVDWVYTAREHRAHRDELVGFLLAAAAGGRISGYVGIVIAAHTLTTRGALFVTPPPTETESPPGPAGGAAFAVDVDAGALSGAVGFLGVGADDLGSLALRSASGTVELPAFRAHVDELPDTGVVSVFDAELPADAVESLAGGSATLVAEFQGGEQWESELRPAEAGEVGVESTTDCRPGSASAIKWGPWSDTEDEADEAAFRKARTAASKACHGQCRASDRTCAYVEEKAVLLETAERTDDADRPSYRSKVESSGRCDCVTGT